MVKAMKVVCISDTHMRHELISVPDGDVLVHAGDFTRRGSLEDVERFDAWLGTLPHRHKIVIAGNHDWCFQLAAAEARRRLTHAQYLEDSGVVIDGALFWGSPWQPWFLDWAFNLQRGAELAAKWSMIPDDVSILVTHGPPFGFGDTTSGGQAVGCEDLLRRIRELQPRLHICGHIHEGSGVRSEGDTTYVNASVLGADYSVAYPARILEV